MTNWIELAVYVLGWVATVKIALCLDDEPLNGEDRLAIGFLSLFWPLGLALMVAVGVFMLPTLRWREVTRHAESLGWAIARRHGIGR